MTPAVWVGVALVIIGSVLLGAKGVVAKLLYARGVDFETVVAVRSVLAIPGFWLLVAMRRGFATLG
ncbi:MAG: hypothetical protein AAGF46_09000, partial [Pseudomonadota bacterium]